MVQQLGIGACATRLDLVAADKLVDVFKPCVLAHINHRTAITGSCRGSTFVRSATQCSALHGHAAGVHRVNLNHPAKTVGFVGVLARIKARVKLAPAVAGGVALAQAPARFMRVGRIGAFKVVDEVFFARQVGAPGCNAATAVVQGAQHASTRGVSSGFHQGMACSRAADSHRCAGGEATCKRGGPHHRPLSTFLFDFDHRHTVRSLRLLHLGSAPVGHAVGMQQAVVHVLVVHHQQAGV